MMKYRMLFCPMVLSLSIAACGSAAAQGDQMPGIDGPYWHQKADYSIECSLDPVGRSLEGTANITYTNNSPDTLSEFFLHLYPNAYGEKATPLIKDYLRGTWFILIGLAESARGSMDVTSLKVDGNDAPFEVEGTILSSTFPKSLIPGQTAAISVSFTEKIRKKLGRAGYTGDHYDIAQWYPKMVVYDKMGWHPDQFRMGEFYGEFGDFDVQITLPEEFVIASTGTVVSGDPGWQRNRPGEVTGNRDGGEAWGPPKTVRFNADNVHDFAWCADPSFIVEKADAGGYRVMSFYRSGTRAWADSVLARSVRTMQWLEKLAGPYGYPQVSVVDVPSAGGMEYPMLVMNGTPEESLILHELGHQWFYGMLANNERDEAWMDEGMTSYQTFLYEEKHYGPYGRIRDRGFFPALFPRDTIREGLERSVIDLHRSGFAEPVATPHHEFRNSDYAMVYTKSSLFMRALRYYVGDEDFSTIMRTYFDRWKFRHVDEETFRSVCEEVSGMDLSEFFKQWLHTTKNCDYRVSRFRVKDSGEKYTADVRVDRKGEMIMPLALVFRLKNGNTVTERVDGFSREYSNTFTFPVKPVSLAVNPDNEILDIYQVDNFAPRRRDFRFDIPGDDRRPMDSYQYRFLPVGHYNDIDGGKAGLRVRGSYDDMYRRFTLQGLYGFESESFDVYGSFEHPIKYLGREATWYSEGYYREGRKGIDLAIRKTRRRDLSEPLAKTYTLGFTYQEVENSAYIIPGTYEPGSNMKSSLFVGMKPKTDVFNASFLLGAERSTWGSDFNYEKLSIAARIWPSRFWSFPLEPGIRFFFGRCTMDPPVQEMFNLAGAGPLDKEGYFWLRSKGAFWKDGYHNFHVPGNGNLRGYYNGDFSFKSLFSTNIEMKVPILPPGWRLRENLKPELFLFYDAGKVLDSRPMEFVPGPLQGSIGEETFDHVLQDFGVGVKVWKLTAQFPFYLSHPGISGEEEKWDYRWTIGFRSLF